LEKLSTRDDDDDFKGTAARGGNPTNAENLKRALSSRQISMIAIVSLNSYELDEKEIANERESMISREVQSVSRIQKKIPNSRSVSTYDLSLSGTS
jgi:hypothetical protein